MWRCPFAGNNDYDIAELEEQRQHNRNKVVIILRAWTVVSICTVISQLLFLIAGKADSSHIPAVFMLVLTGGLFIWGMSTRVHNEGRTPVHLNALHRHLKLLNEYRFLRP